MARVVRWVGIFARAALLLAAVVGGWLWMGSYVNNDLGLRDWIGVAAIGCAIWPAASAWLWWRGREKRRERNRSGHCGKCGYDLHGTPHRKGQLVAKCPECGTEFLWAFVKSR
jgi:ribosomal protein S27AE